MRATFLSDSVTQSSDPLALKSYRQHVSASCNNGVGGRSGGVSGIPEPEGRDAIRITRTKRGLGQQMSVTGRDVSVDRWFLRY